MKRWALGAALAILGGAYSGSAASAVTYEPEPSFCEEAVVHDYFAPFQRMPKLHVPGRGGGIGFGPRSLRLNPLQSLVVGKGTVGYTLRLRFRAPPVRVRWDVTTMLFRIDWKGRATDVLDGSARRVKLVRGDRNVGAEFDVGNTPAAYRLSVSFHNLAGRKLGAYGFYFRVVPSTRNASLRLNAASFHTGQRVFGRLENLGTATLLHGPSYAIERFDGTMWVRAPESPRDFTLPLFSTPAGRAEGCSAFWIPASMAPGRYRMMKTVEFVAPPVHARGVERTLYAEFDVLP